MTTEPSEPDSPHLQTALACAALAVAFAAALRELNPDVDALATVQSKVSVELARLRRTPGAGDATDILRFVRDKLRNPDIIEQPEL